MILTTATLCLALNIYHEARGEFIPGQYAVAAVTMNRAKSKKNVCKVVTRPRQFSWTNNMVDYEGAKPVLKAEGYPKEKRAWALAQHIAKYVLKNNLADITNGATHYHTKSVKPGWSKRMEKTKYVGKHIFYKLAAKSVVTRTT